MALDIQGGFVGYRATSGTWIARLRIDGKQKFHGLGKFEDHRDAIRAAKKWMQSLQQGVMDPELTVDAACNYYLKWLLIEKGRETFLDARGRLQRRVLGRSKAMAVQQRAKPIEPHPLATKKLESLKAADLVTWRDALGPEALQGEARRKARASSNRDISALLASLNHAYRNQLCSTNRAWSSIGLFPNVGARSGPTYISPQQRRALIGAAVGNVADLLTGLCLMGARPRELTRCVGWHTEVEAETRSETPFERTFSIILRWVF